MKIKELIENGKGYLELNGNKIDLENPQFKDIMKWNENIANGEVRDGIAYGENCDKLEWNWVSLEENLQEVAKETIEEEKKEDNLIEKIVEEEVDKMEDVIEEIAEEIVNDIVTTEKGKDKTK
jgi:hypothetical protein